MKYVGNFIHLIPQKLINEMENYPVKSSIDDEEFHEKFQTPPEVTLPESIFNTVCGIWFAKHPPGSGVPFHKDDYDEYEHLELKRFFMFLYDWQPGHIFLYDETKTIENYVAGDTYEMTDIHCLHAACNISNSPRITMQVLSCL